MLRRKVQRILQEYYHNGSNKILVIDGARQIGKSYIIRHEGQKYFKNYIEVNFWEDKRGNQLFADVTTVKDFYLRLSAYAGDRMGNASDTLVFLDEIQVYPSLLTLLKFLKDDERFTYIVSGSQLGLALNQTMSRPGGRIQRLKMFPMDFEEFLWANDVGEEVIEHARNQFNNFQPLEQSLHRRFLDLYKRYLLIGGIPDAVNTYLQTSNIVAVRAVHDEIQSLYTDDAVQYNPSKALIIKRIYEMIPSNMENKKNRLYYTDIEGKKGKRSSDYIEELEYLVASGIALDVLAISNPKFPLKESESKKLIKLYLNDVGLLTNILYKYNINAILADVRSINLGAIYETAVAQELKAHGYELKYYDNKVKGEVDYLVDDYDNLTVLPIEVKSGKDYKNHRALDKFVDNEEYNIKRAVVLSNDREIMVKDKISYLPIYYSMFFKPSTPESIIIP